jgi:hypothetical protein
LEVDHAGGGEQYLPVEDIARRLDLPLGVLLRRVEAGDVPSKREVGPFGVRYSLRLSDLGIESANDVTQAAPGNSSSVDVMGSRSLWPDQLGAAPAPPSRELQTADPRHELAAMTIDPRELVAGLLDRWERTLEQRIYAEQRMRFEAELNTRQNLVKQLQLELQTARAEQAAALADRDRRLAENERRNLELQNELAAAREAAARRRRLFRR